MKVFRTIARIVGWTLFSVLALVVCVCLLAYFPPVQQFAVDKASEILAEKTGMHVSVERFRIRFPLGVSLRGTEVVMPSGDTLARIDRLRTNVSASFRRFKNHDVMVRRVVLDGADIRLGPLMADTTLFAPKASKDTLPTAFPWTIEVRRLEISRSRVSLPSPDLQVDSLQISARNITYAGSDISASLRRLALSERVSGIQVKSGSGDFAMTATDFSLSDFSLATAASHIEADAKVGSGITNLDSQTPVTLSVSGEIAADEVMHFAPLPPNIAGALHSQTLILATTLDGTLNDITIEHLAATMLGKIDLTASGKVRSVTAPANISGNVSLDAQLTDLDFAKAFLPDTMLQKRIAFPHRMKLETTADFSPEKYDVREFTLTADAGELDVKGSLGLREKTYDVQIRFTDFPFGEFLPRDSLGDVTLSLAARGRGFDPFGGMAAWVRLGVAHLVYKNTDYHDVRLAAGLARGRFDLRASSANQMLDFQTTMKGTLDGNMAQRRYNVTAEIAETFVRVDSTLYHIDSTAVRFASDPTRTSAGIRTGDLALDLTSPLALDSLIRGATGTGKEIQRQLRARHFSADSLQSAFPSVQLTASAGRVNLLREIVMLRGFDFRSLSADVSTIAGAPFSIDASVLGLSTGKFTLDTLNFFAHRNANQLDYDLRVANRPGNNDHLGLIEVSGSAGGNTLSVNVQQRNRSDSIGFRFGVQASLAGKTLHADMTPNNPIFAYEPWSVGSGSGVGGGDWVEWDMDGAMRADLHLTGPTTTEYVNLSSASLPDIPNGALALTMEGLDLGSLLDLLPAPPPLGGKLLSDITFGFNKGIIAAKGALGVADFSYHERRVANVDADIDFQSDSRGRMILDAGVKLEDKTALTAKGYYTTQAMDFAIQIPDLPLSLADGFVPSETATLTGNFNGNLHVTGIPADPTLSGDVGFTDGIADVLMTGTMLKISPDRITIANGRAALNGFGIVAPNNQKLALTGSVNIADLKNPIADLALSASNFRVVDSQHIGGSQVYGTAAFDAGITARGPLSSMLVRGSVNILQATNLTYIMRNTSRLKDEKQHIVEFRDFVADSLYAALNEPVEALAPLRPSVDMLVSVDIADGVRVTMSLDELSENRIALIGGGTLSYSMNAQGDMRLAGRYTLSGGTIYYKPPMIGQKIFAVSDGSYVGWSGVAMNPEFHVTATQTSDIELTYDDGLSEEVAFDISIDVQGSLSAIDMRFDVEAPDNLAIQNELLSMSEEERMRQALMLLISGQYNGMSASSKSGVAFDARKQIGDFISKEVNQWARNNLKGVDFQMGIASHNDLGGGTSTDYSYSVSKSLINDRMKISVGGRVSDNTTGQNFADNLLGDVQLEYRLTQRDNMFAKLYRTTARESILEGEVTETGGGFMLRKKINKLGDLFKRRKKNDKK